MSTMKLCNCTPHILNIIGTDGIEIVLPPSGLVPRLSVDRVHSGEFAGVTLWRPTLSVTTALPEPVEGTIFVVSAIVAEANPSRKDLASPGEVIRNEQGQPIGCRGLSIYWR